MGKYHFRQPREEMFSDIERRFEVEMPTRKTPNEIANCLNNILFDEFEKTREIEGGSVFSLKPKFVGEYMLNPANPEEIITFAHVGKGCSPLPSRGGIIGRAIRTGRSQYVPNVHKDEDHVSCNESMNGSEAVYLAISKPYTFGPDTRKKIPYAVLDIDLNVLDALSS